jgi:tetratricopeptide (TPR) repeat protein
MMLLLGILIISGACADLIMNGFSGPHALLIACGALLVIVNIVGKKLRFGRVMGKNIASIIVLAVTAFIMFGFFPTEQLEDTGDMGALIRKSEKILESDGPKQTMKYLEESSAKLSWNRELIYRLGSLREADLDYNGAKDCYQDIINRNAYDVDARYRIAAILAREKNYSQAIGELKQVALLDPKYADAYMSLGDCYMEMGDGIRGVFNYKMAVSGDGKSLEKRVKLANAYARMNSYDKANEEFNKALDMANSYEEKLSVYSGYSASGIEPGPSD